MKQVTLAALVILGVTLACTQAVVTPPVTPSPSPVPAVTRTPEATPAARTGATATVLRAVVNLRDNPGGVVIGNLEAGDTVTVLECLGDWCKVKSLEQMGYIWRGCLSGNPDVGCEAR